jgi:hypothetical protein
VELPDAQAIFPYLGLFTLVPLDPGMIRDPIPTLFEPPLSIIRGKNFVKAHSNASPTNKNVARIFAPLALVDDSPRNLGAIPISPDDQTFNEKRYWRLPVPSAHIFAALIGRLQDITSDCLDIRLAEVIHSLLKLQQLGEHLLDENDGNVGPSNAGGGGGSGPNDDNKGGRGPKGGGRTSSKRKHAGGDSGASPSKSTKKARKMSGGSESKACDESGGRGPKGGGRTSSKRKHAGGESGASPSKSTKKARKTSGGSESRACDESGGRGPKGGGRTSSKSKNAGGKGGAFPRKGTKKARKTSGWWVSLLVLI